MNLSKSIELLKKINDGKDYDKEYNFTLNSPKETQISAKEVVEKFSKEQFEYISEKIENLKKSSLYARKSEIHGKKHIENVMLFAMIISLYENLSANDRELLLEAAKYHDQGRVNDIDEQHGTESAYIAGNELKDKYSNDDLKIIQAAIIFHDDRTKGNSLQEIEDIGFKNIVEKLNIKEENIARARKIGNILKDADALDRARFIEDTIPIDERYLRTEISKKLIKVAMELHEAISLEKLKVVMDNESESVKEQIKKYLKEMSPIRVKQFYLCNIIK